MNPLPSKTNETLKTQNEDPDDSELQSEAQLKTLKNSQFFEPVENFSTSRNGSIFSDLRLSFTTEEVIPSQRTSIISEDLTEVNFYQFKFEQKTQKKLKNLAVQVKHCRSCKTTSCFIDKLVLQELGFFQLVSYWLHSFQCCSDPKVLGKYLVKKSFCIYCGRSEE